MKTKISLCTNTYKETFRDSNYDTVWANSESLSSKDYRSTYGRSQGKKPDPTIYRIIEKGELAIFCQDGINNILLCENEPGVQTFGGHICEGYIFLYDGPGIRWHLSFLSTI
ncbi:unnamed protein product [Rhizophagus irregularis]|nr:unnamed protein product [Rhizophagus irregularis]CAB5334302.1 unnamed protein product [Rhizophagus irregularis]